MPPFINFLMHLDEQVSRLVSEHGAWAYGILFAVIFLETGLVIMPFLPGDSLLFAVGMFCHPTRHGFSYWEALPLLICAAFLGDNVNYQIGMRLGPWLFRNEESKVFRRSYLDKTHAFFERHGGWTLVLARFVPIVRTFAPFVAGMGAMTFPRFLLFSAAGAFIWVFTCLTSGYLFGQIPWVQDNFELMMLGLIVVSVIPAYFKMRSMRKDAKSAKLKVETEVAP